MIREAQRAEVYPRTFMDLLDAGTEKPPWATVKGADLKVQQLYAQWEALQIQNGILYRNFMGTDSQVRWRQLLVSRFLRAPLLQQLHAGPTAGHMGVKKTPDRVMKMSYLRSWRANVVLFCRRCIQCNRYRRGPVAHQGEL